MNDKKQSIVSDAEAFLELKTLAVVGVSPDGKKFGNYIFKELKSRKFNIYQIHPSANEINGSVCYNNLKSIPQKVDGLIVNAKPEKTLGIIKEYHEQDINNFWIQRGSDSTELDDYLKSTNINSIRNKCILMFAEPVTSIHKFHFAIWKWFGKN